MLADISLASLAAGTGLSSRTIRSWVAQGLIPGPLNRGPNARYAADTFERLLAIRTMRDILGIPLPAIRQELLVATPDQIASYAAKAVTLAPEPTELQSFSRSAPPNDAQDYLREIRVKAAFMHDSEPGSRSSELAAASNAGGFEVLEKRLAGGRPKAAMPRKARTEDWSRIPVTPDVEFHVRGRLDAEARARIERCADLIRDILLGRDR